jgi:predicted house-cleaning noncanonical NTP pyrophosphatase (MazG superfamily)
MTQPIEHAIERLENLSVIQFKKVLLYYQVSKSEIPDAGARGEKAIAVVEYARQKEGEQLTDLFKVINEVAPQKKYQINVNDLRTHLINRTDQKLELNKAIKEHNRQYPFFCLIHGDKYQCHDRYLERMLKYDLHKPITDSDNDIPCIPLDCRFGKGVDKLHEEILDKLKDKYFNDNIKDIINIISSEQRNILFYTSMCTNDWSKSGGVKVIQDLIQFWKKDLFDSDHNHLLLICISFKYTKEKTNFLSRWFKKSSINNQIRQEFQRLKLDKFGVNGIVLPELENIHKSEVEAWVRTHFWDYLEILNPEIDNFFNSDETKTMEELVNKFTPILKEHCT